MSLYEVLIKMMKIVNGEINVLGNVKRYVSDKRLNNFIRELVNKLEKIKDDINKELILIGDNTKEINIFYKIYNDFKISFKLVNNEFGVVEVLKEMALNNDIKLKQIPVSEMDKNTKRILDKLKSWQKNVLEVLEIDNL